MEALLEGAAAFVAFGDWGICVCVVCVGVGVDVGSCGRGCVCRRWRTGGLGSPMGMDWREGLHGSGARGR